MVHDHYPSVFNDVQGALACLPNNIHQCVQHTIAYIIQLPLPLSVNESALLVCSDLQMDLLGHLVHKPWFRMESHPSVVITRYIWGQNPYRLHLYVCVLHPILTENNTLPFISIKKNKLLSVPVRHQVLPGSDSLFKLKGIIRVRLALCNWKNNTPSSS